MPLCADRGGHRREDADRRERMTMSVNLNITSFSDSKNFSSGSRFAAGTWVSAMAKSTVKKTTCSTSFFAAASKKLVGTVCSSTPDRVVGVLANCCPASAEPASTTPTPGLATLTATRPTRSATVVTTSK